MATKTTALSVSILDLLVLKGPPFGWNALSPSTCQTEHPLYAAGGTVSVLAPSMATTAREDTWPIDGLCIYNYQLATQVENRQVHPSRLEPNRRSDLRLTKPPEKSDSTSTCSVALIWAI